MRKLRLGHGQELDECAAVHVPQPAQLRLLTNDVHQHRGLDDEVEEELREPKEEEEEKSACRRVAHA